MTSSGPARERSVVHLLEWNGRRRDRYDPDVTDHLFGRDDDAARLRDALSSHRWVTLLGAPGVGKSALARRHAGARSSVRVDLGGVESGALLPALIADAAGLDPEAPGPDWILPDSAPDLLVLDQADALLDDLAAFLPRWLDRRPALRVLVTSRERVGSPREFSLELAPLSLAAARDLLLARARAVRAGWGDDEDAVAAVVGRLDGLPLALELAAARASLLSPADLAARLDAPLELLRPARGTPGLRESLSASLEGVSDEGRGAFAWLSTFGTAFDVAAAEQVIGGVGAGLDELHELVGRSLLSPVEDARGRARFRLLSVVRAHAAELLEERGEAQQACLAHARWLAHSAWALACEVAGPSGPEALRQLQELRAELARVVVVGWLPGELASPLALAIDRLHRHRGGVRAHAALLDAALDRGEDPRVRAARERLRRLGGEPAGALAALDGDHPELRLERAAALLDLGRNRAARQLLEELAEGLPASADEVDLAVRVAELRARALALRGRPDDAARLLEAALARDESTLGPLPQARCLQELAQIELLRGRKHEAGRALDQAVVLLDGLPESRLRAGCFLLRAEVLQSEEPLAQAAAAFREAGDRRGEARATERRVELLVGAGAHREARDLLGPLLRTARTLQSVGQQARLLELAALLDWHLHGAKASLPALEEACGLAEQGGDGAQLALVWALRAAVQASEGQTAEARQGFARAEDRVSATTHRAPPPDVFLHRAHLDLAEGRPDAAADRLIDAWRLAASLGRNHQTAAGVLRRRAPFRLALRLVSRALEPGLRLETWAKALDPSGRALLVDADASSFRPPGGAWVDRTRYTNQRRLLLHLAREHRAAPVSADAIQEVIWPGEKILLSAAQNRIHKVISLLRKAGLGELVQRSADGYALAADQDVLILPDLPPEAP